MLSLLALGSTGCQEPVPMTKKMDLEYGFMGFTLGNMHYAEIRRQIEARNPTYEVIEFESFGRRFFDNQQLDRWDIEYLFGEPLNKMYAGAIDGEIYAYLVQMDAEPATQEAISDTLTWMLGAPDTSKDSVIVLGEEFLIARYEQWEGSRVGLAYGQGEGFAEFLIYDIQLKKERDALQRKLERARNNTAVHLASMKEVGAVRLELEERTARWRYRYRGQPTLLRQGSFGTIDYTFLQPFFNVKGKSHFGLDMVFATLSFSPGTDSLEQLEVRFENSQGQTSGFMDMLNILEGQLGRHTYSDTLHTKAGHFRRAFWQSSRRHVRLEEDRYRPERINDPDLVVTFSLERVRGQFVQNNPPEEAKVDSMITHVVY